MTDQDIQGKTIWEAAGQTVCTCDDYVPDSSGGSDCGRCGETPYFPDLRKPENLHLLHECVWEILGDWVDRWIQYGDNLARLVYEARREELELFEPSYADIWVFHHAVASLATPEQIITAILPIAEKKLEKKREEKGDG